MLGQCTALAHLNLSNNLMTAIGAVGAERLAVLTVLAQCTALTRLNLSNNYIGAVGRWGLRVLWCGRASDLLLEDSDNEEDD